MTNGLTKQWGDATITLDSETMMFNVQSGEWKKTCASFAEATDAIDRHEKAMAKTKAKRVAIACIDPENGNRYTIMGVHAGNGNLLTAPKRDHYTCRNLVIEHPVTVALIAKILDLEKQVSDLRDDLRQYAVSCYKEYESYSEGRHDAWVAHLEKTATAAKERADKAAMCGYEKK